MKGARIDAEAARRLKIMASSSRFAVAIHVLTLMARAGSEPLKSEHVAKSVNTNPVVIRRILCQLARARLVISQTGAAGGSRLARQPGRITLLEVYNAVEACDLFALHRQPPNQDCFVGMNIETALAGVLAEVNQSVGGVLSGITVEHMLERLQPCRRTARTKASHTKPKRPALSANGAKRRL
jgi:Rrf2 family protein